MSSSLLEEIIAEVKLRNPDGSPEEIFEIVSAFLGKEVLPNVIKNISLPRFPTYREITSEDKTAKGKIEKTHYQRNLSYTRRMIQQIESVRNDFGWDGIDDSKPSVFINNSTSTHYKSRTIHDLTKEDGQIKRGLKEEPEEIISATTQKITEKSEKNIINLSENTQRKIVSEPIFGQVFRNVEIQLRDVITKRKLRTELDVECKNDAELSSWQKCVIKIHPKVAMNFTERMNISTVFDVTVRKQINELKKNADETTIKYLNNLNKDLFVHIDL